MNGRKLSHGFVALALLFSLQGCKEGEEKKPFVTKERNQAIEAQGNEAAQVPTAPSPSASVAPPPAKPRKALCKGQLERPGRELSKATLDRAKAASGSELPEHIPLGKGRWTWLNFWAAWCVPCREEIPRLRSWEGKLNAGGERFRLVFVSLDDDERQLRGFLEKQPKGGLTTTYWIKEGDQREEWFKAVDMDPDPQLPAHILLDPKGMVRCIVDGAVEDSDFSAVEKIIKG